MTIPTYKIEDNTLLIKVKLSDEQMENPPEINLKVGGDGLAFRFIPIPEHKKRKIKTNRTHLVHCLEESGDAEGVGCPVCKKIIPTTNPPIFPDIPEKIETLVTCPGCGSTIIISRKTVNQKITYQAAGYVRVENIKEKTGV